MKKRDAYPLAESVGIVTDAGAKAMINALEEQSKLRDLKVCQSISVAQASLCFVANELSMGAVLLGLSEEDFIADLIEMLKSPVIREHQKKIRNDILNLRRKALLKGVKK